MNKRRIESSSSSSSDNNTEDDSSQSLECRGGTANSNSRAEHLSTGNESRKKARNDKAGQQEQSHVASTSSQFQVGIIVKEEVKESGVELEHAEEEHDEVVDSQPQKMDVACSNSAPTQQSQPHVRRSQRKRVLSRVWSYNDPKKKKLSRSKKVVLNPRKKYLEGCLVMGLIDNYPRWPGMIRKAGADDRRDPGYTFNRRGIWFFVQFFTDPTTFLWLRPWELMLFKAAKPNRCNHRLPTVVVEFEKGIKIATAAANYSVETRLAKFTLLDGAAIDSLLAEIDNANSDHITTAQQTIHQDDTPAENSDSPAATSQGNNGSSTDSVAQNGSTHPTRNEESCPDSVAQNGSTHPTNGNGESCPDSFEIMIEERISEYQKLREEWNREKEEEIRSLATEKAKLAEENNKLTRILKQQTISIAELQAKQEKEKQEHRAVLENEKQKWKTEVENEKQKWKIEVEKERLELKKEVEKEKQEKLKYKQESEKRKAILEKSFPALKSTTQT